MVFLIKIITVSTARLKNMAWVENECVVHQKLITIVCPALALQVNTLMLSPKVWDNNECPDHIL